MKRTLTDASYKRDRRHPMKPPPIRELIEAAAEPTSFIFRKDGEIECPFWHAFPRRRWSAPGRSAAIFPLNIRGIEAACSVWGGNAMRPDDELERLLDAGAP
jgi:hypothetical protein